MLTDRSLSPTTFVAGPDEQLITDDVYSIKDDNVINGLPALTLPTLDLSTADGLVSSDLDSLRGGQSKAILPTGGSGILNAASNFIKNGVAAVGGLPGVVKAITQKTGPSLLSRLTSGAGLTGIPGLAGSSASNLTNILKQATTGDIGKAINIAVPNSLGTFVSSPVTGSVPNRISSSTIGNNFNISNLIGNITGSNPTIIDKDSTAHLISAISSAAISSGMPGPFSSVATLAAGNNDVIYKAAGMAAQAASKSGNVSALKDITSTAGVAALIGLGKSLLTKTSSNYTSPPNASAANVLSEYDLIKSSYQDINSDWASKIRELPDINSSTPGATVQEQVIDISTIQNGSPDFLSTIETGALNSSVPDEKYYTLATAFAPSTPEDALKKCFPMTSTSVNSQSVFDELATVDSGLTPNTTV